jgi:hypothetical protein
MWEVRIYLTTPQILAHKILLSQSPSYRFEQLISGSTEYRIVQMNSTDNLFDIATYTRGFINKTHINGQLTSTLVYDGALSNYTYTSPLSRQTKVTVDNVERPTQFQFATDHPVALSYDSQGRLSQVSQSNRTTLYRYSSLGNIANIRNALGQITRFTHDRSGKNDLTKLSPTTPNIIYLR